MDRDARTILLRDNPWIERPARLASWLQERLPHPCVARLQLVRAARRWPEQRKAHLLIGPRQAGKTTAIWSHLAARTTPVLHLDCEQAAVRGLCRSAPLLLADLEQLVPQPVALFFDEVQHLEEAGVLLKGIVDRRYGAPLLVTGSGSFHLGDRTRETLAGRATRSRLLPFSLAEVCQELSALAPSLQAVGSEQRLARHLVIGGYPEAWLADDPAPILADLTEAVILRDASDRFRIARPDAFRRLLRLIAGQVGSLVNYAEWAALLGVSRDTVASYLGILEESHVLITLPPFAGGRRSELTGRPKVYFVDPGLRNHLLGSLRPFEERPDVGPLLEQWVLAELWKSLPDGATLHFWRSTSGAEVDFVLAFGDRTIGIEVKAQPLREPRLPRALHSFVAAYSPPDLLVVNLGLDEHARLGDTRVRYATPLHLADQLAEALTGERQGERPASARRRSSR